MPLPRLHAPDVKCRCLNHTELSVLKERKGLLKMGVGTGGGVSVWGWGFTGAAELGCAVVNGVLGSIMAPAEARRLYIFNDLSADASQAAPPHPPPPLHPSTPPPTLTRPLPEIHQHSSASPPHRPPPPPSRPR
ncbi:unnamed protein product [Pleuronectes platessa]|uniref:Uncharacterized protein n=1 Tax=Pleuronectes platessa TaxID=8262 RepID=A0A9N7VP22_PLEPL|nr:unnamed protein product [Pleuronectes platessa]